VPELLTAPGTCAVGLVRRSEHGAVTELLVDELAAAGALPNGTQYAPWADLAAIVSPTAEQSRDPREWLRRLQPRPGQLLVVALLGLGEGRRRWNGLVAQGDAVQPLVAVRVVGRGMIRAFRQADATAERTPAELLRWSRTRGALGDAVCQKIRSASVALIGASRSGSLLAWMLAAVGVERLLLVDPDSLELHNLDAMCGVTEFDVGQRKAEALARRLTQFRSDLAVHALTCSVTDARVVECVRGVDLLATCVDRDMPRLAAALLAERFLKVHLDIGTGVTRDDAHELLIAGDVRLLLPGRGCVCCVGGLADEEAARYELLAPPGALQRGPLHSWQQERAGSLVTINAMSVAAGVQLWLDLLGGTLANSHWSRFRWRSGHGLEVHAGPVTAGDQCAVCHPARPSTE
jgi:hypothetical protein